MSLEEFTAEVMKYNKDLYIHTEIDTAGNKTMCSFVYQEDSRLPLRDKHLLAVHMAINDDGMSVYPATNSFQIYYAPEHIWTNTNTNTEIEIASTDSKKEIIEKLSAKMLKCVCGANSTGSNKHSYWCDIKENS